jgi:hypothetical protein
MLKEWYRAVRTVVQLSVRWDVGEKLKAVVGQIALVVPGILVNCLATNEHAWRSRF